MRTLLQVLQDVRGSKMAIGHFNVSNLEQFKAVCLAAQEVKLPVVVGVSEGERDYFGVRQIAALLKSVREERGLEIYLNADHTHSILGVLEAVGAGFDAVLFDGGKLAFEENIRQTREAVQAAKRINSSVLVEGEIGYIGSGSQMLDAMPAGVSLGEALTSSDDAERFVTETKVDLLAPAVGTIHGILKNLPNPRLDIPRIASIAAISPAPLVLHGGSGTSDADFRASVEAGVSLIHVSTELRLLWRKELEKTLANQKDEINPGRVGAKVVDALRALIVSRMKLFALQV